MTITIETINGKPHTVVWHGLNKKDVTHGFKAIQKYGESIVRNNNVHYLIDGEIVLATALPPLSRNPKPEHAKLLYAYMAEGVDVMFTHEDINCCVCSDKLFENDGKFFIMPTRYDVEYIEELYSKGEITHAKYENTRVEIALED